MLRKFVSRLRIDAPLPPSGPSRYLVLLGLVVGGLVAASVPIFLALMIWGVATGQDAGAPERAAPAAEAQGVSPAAPGRD